MDIRQFDQLRLAYAKLYGSERYNEQDFIIRAWF